MVNQLAMLLPYHSICTWIYNSWYSHNTLSFYLVGAARISLLPPFIRKKGKSLDLLLESIRAGITSLAILLSISFPQGCDRISVTGT